MDKKELNKSEILNKYMLEYYEIFPYGDIIIKPIKPLLKNMIKNISEAFPEKKEEKLKQLYTILDIEISEFYGLLFNFICINDFEIIKTDEEIKLVEKFFETTTLKNARTIKNKLAKKITERFIIENPEMLNKELKHLGYFKNKIIMGLILFSAEMYNELSMEFTEKLLANNALKKERLYLPNKKYDKDDYDFIIKLKETEGIPFNRGVEKLIQKSNKNINPESFLRRLSEYYNKKNTK